MPNITPVVVESMAAASVDALRRRSRVAGVVLALACMQLAACEQKTPAAAPVAETPSRIVSSPSSTPAAATDAGTPSGSPEALAEIAGAQLADLHRGELVKQLHFRDVDGEGLLLLSRETGSRPGDDDVDIDQVILVAQLYRRKGADAEWASAWRQPELVECEGLDLVAQFYPDLSAVSDLDGDGHAELSFATDTFCGGGVDAHALHVELRQGEQRYVAEGPSLLPVGTPEPEDGVASFSPAAASMPAPIRARLEQDWDKIKGRPWSDLPSEEMREQDGAAPEQPGAGRLGV